MRRMQSQGAMRGAPRDKPVVLKQGNRNILKPKGSRNGKLGSKPHKTP